VPGKAAPAPDPAWRWRHLLLAPHRLGFFLAMGVLVFTGGWWALVQVDRPALLNLSYAAAVAGACHSRDLRFIPLFFWAFCHGWSQMARRAPEVPQLRAPLVLAALGPWATGNMRTPGWRPSG
jgi:uncharacterized protein involved in response to NO